MIAILAAIFDLILIYPCLVVNRQEGQERREQKTQTRKMNFDNDIVKSGFIVF
jgi:hypothetical protein